MKVIAIIVQSVNGRITKGSDPNVYKWTSQEDKLHLKETIGKASLIVMGSTTYEEAKRNITLLPQIQRIVLTSRPQDYAQEAVPGQLEFYSMAPQDVVKKYGEMGHKELLLLGGSKIYSEFLKQGLINEIWLTVEPVIFGQGKPLIDTDRNVSMKLLSLEKLNDKGTLLLKYQLFFS
ncbi:hypothetical protein A2957_00530 [Candidatus Roizmanbacteria bacterium RIFCSPLOWO2_01_FULL_38_11]|nr:MAG: hypothetical protein A2957_00530 [Candidatus Roizmanbacteria bacterium RIFCSPLOWO2_01_FULL_38_11]